MLKVTVAIIALAFAGAAHAQNFDPDDGMGLQPVIPQPIISTPRMPDYTLSPAVIEPVPMPRYPLNDQGEAPRPFPMNGQGETPNPYLPSGPQSSPYGHVPGYH